MAPLVKALAACPELDSRVAVTGQHRQMLDQVLDLFGIVPEVDLDLMQPGQTLENLTARVLNQLEPVLEHHRPDLILVQGDTTTAFASALGAFYKKIPVGHVEAGLRTVERYNPFPEEMNRRLISQIATLHFAPTEIAMEACLRDGISKDAIHLTGNTVIDALLQVAAGLPPIPATKQRTLLVTAHRRENWGTPMESIFDAVRTLLEARPDLDAVVPLHLNPLVQEVGCRLLGDHPRVRIVPPLDYLPFIEAMRRATLILTDSGGVQEEAPSLGKPVLVLRTTTERPEAVRAGTVKMVGTDRDTIVTEALRLLDDQTAYQEMARAVNPYGDGKSVGRIVEIIRWFLGLRADRPQDIFRGTERPVEA